MLLKYCNILFLFHSELEFRKGDTIRILQGIDENWIEGEYDGNIGIFPVSYVEVRRCFFLFLF